MADIGNASLQRRYFPASQKQASTPEEAINGSGQPSVVPFRFQLDVPVEDARARSCTTVRPSRLYENDLLPPTQSAYRDDSIPPSRRCWSLTTTSTPVIDVGHVVALTLLDLSSAFDAVHHSILLSTLQSRCSVTGRPLEWFRESDLTSQSHSRVRRRRSHWRLTCPNAPALTQRSSSRTRNVLSTSSQCRRYSVLYDHCSVTIAYIQRSCNNDLAALFSLLPLQLNHHEIRVYLVRLTCKSCKDPVRPAVDSADLLDGLRER